MRITLFNLFIIAKEKGKARKLYSELLENGFSCSITADGDKAVEKLIERAPDLVLVAMDGLPASSEVRYLAQRIKQERRLPVIALVSREALISLNADCGTDDFVVEPWEVAEVVARIKRVLRPTNNTADADLAKCGDLVINLAKCEVSLDSQVVSLTFKEYELLRFLASNRGRVFTRESLLNKVWGYDYYGGDRTVDVHIRRLRSKIEDSTHSFIDTVRNIGYRFRDD